MILSDRTLREQLAAGRIVVEPLDPSCIQPSSIDLHADRQFRVFRNHTMGHIDVKQELDDLTELVEVPEDGVFILHPGEFVLGSTLERVALPDDLVARLEGKSSLGRLGLLIHSSLPGDEPIAVLSERGLGWVPIEEVVRARIDAHVVGFDPATLQVGYHRITGWYEGPPDRIFEVRLGSGRRVRVTAGHNLFGRGRDGGVRKLRTVELAPGTMVAVPSRLPIPPPTGLAAMAAAPARAAPAMELAAAAMAAPGSRGRPGPSGAPSGSCAPSAGQAALGACPDSLTADVPGSPAGPACPGPAHSREAGSGGELAWDPVEQITDTGAWAPVFDISVRPGGARIETFLAGGGVFVANTAGFIDAGFDGHITLELSNVANLPITIYPGMKIGQISFLQMTTPADAPYGSAGLGSKYKGQRGPTPSRYHENFRNG